MGKSNMHVVVVAPDFGHQGETVGFVDTASAEQKHGAEPKT